MSTGSNCQRVSRLKMSTKLSLASEVLLKRWYVEPDMELGKREKRTTAPLRKLSSLAHPDEYSLNRNSEGNKVRHVRSSFFAI